MRRPWTSKAIRWTLAILAIYFIVRGGIGLAMGTQTNLFSPRYRLSDEQAKLWSVGFIVFGVGLIVGVKAAKNN